MATVSGQRSNAIPKCISIGVYDDNRGLVHITRQRGKLLFHMGVRANPSHTDESTNVSRVKKNDTFKSIFTSIPLSLGAYTGLSLYGEEAYYLLERNALVIYDLSALENEMNEGQIQEFVPISIEYFVQQLIQKHGISMQCLEVYAYLKYQKYYPQRCYGMEKPPMCYSPTYSNVESLTPTFNVFLSHRTPNNMNDVSRCLEVSTWSKAAKMKVECACKPPNSLNDDKFEMLNDETLYKTEEKLKIPVNQEKRKILKLAFRILVCRFEDALPSMGALRASISKDNLPWKIAAVQREKNILLFEMQ